MLMIFLLCCLLFSQGVLHQVVYYTYQQQTNFCDRKIKAITAPIPNIVYVLIHFI